MRGKPYFTPIERGDMLETSYSEDTREQKLREFLASESLPEKVLPALNVALTHKSYTNEVRQGFDPNLDKHNQRLEFLGDSVLGLVIAHHFYASKRKTAEDDLETAQNDYNEALRKLEEITRERDAILATLDAAKATEAEAKHQYEISLDGPNADQLAVAKANLDAAKDALSNYVITAPFSGVVADVIIKAGEQVTPDTRVVSVIDDSQWYAETTDVTELEVVNLSIGQSVTMRPDALSDLELTGTVEEISNAYTQSGGDILYTVRIRVNGSDPRLKWGMTLETIFTSAQ